MSTVTPLRGRTARIEGMLNDPRVSFWLRDALIELCDRDPVDAVEDVRRLYVAMRERLDEVQGRL